MYGPFLTLQKLNRIVIEYKMGAFCNYQITNGIKSDKLDLKWLNTSFFRLFSWGMSHNCYFLNLSLDYF